MKTLAVKLPDEVHAKLVILAGIANTSLGELLKQAAERFANEAGTSPEFVAKAEQMLRTLDRETRNRRDAIEGLLKPGKAPAAKATAKARKPEGSKP